MIGQEQRKRTDSCSVIPSNMSRAARALPEPVLIRARTSCGESHTSTAGICVGGKLSGMAQPAVESSSVPTGSDGVIRVGARREGVRGSGRGGGDNCSTMSEPPCAAAASLSRCRRRRNLRATFSALQLMATVESLGIALRHHPCQRRRTRYPTTTSMTADESGVVWTREMEDMRGGNVVDLVGLVNLGWVRLVGSDMIDASGRPHIRPTYGSGMGLTDNQDIWCAMIG
mgnify:CR=1 FL=1